MDGHRMGARVRRGRCAVLGLGLALALALGAGPGCDLAGLLGELGLSDGAAELSGQNAFVHLRARASVASAADTDAILEVLAWRADGTDSTEDEAQFRPSAGALDLLQATTRQRKAIKPRSFDLVEFPGIAGGQRKARKALFVPPDLSRLQDEYVIPHLNAIPVRNQGSRGTCAAFTGIGHVEYAALRANPSLGTLDLSEQRFYWASKPECQASGCTELDAGSWYGDGFQASIDAGRYDIPLEASCPYDPNQYANELQTPLRASCSDGVVQVQQVQIVYQPEDMIRVLEEGLPVPFASPLSDNFFENDGLITRAAAGSVGDIQHAAGHAYLLVGYRLLPSMPQEGGMCFIVKNSWGPGWGVNGYSCITLAWMQEWNFGQALEHPVVVDIALSPDLGGQPYDDSAPDFADCEVYADETVDCSRLDDGNANVPPAPEPPADLAWYETSLVGPDGRLYEAELADDAEGATWVRGTLRETGALTGTVYLRRSGADLLWDGDVVGRVNGDRVELCTGAFDLLCSLRFEPATNDLYVEFVYGEYRSVKDDEIGEGQWMSLGALPGVGEDLEYHQPSDWSDLLLQPLYVRGLGADGRASNPIRLVLRGLDIKAMGQPVGSLDPTDLGLCTGSFRDACGLFSGADRLLVLPTW